MGLFNPSFITKNRLGIFIFQVRIPAYLGHKQKFYRRSLQTRDPNQALAAARKLKILWDTIAVHFFENEESFNHAKDVLNTCDFSKPLSEKHTDSFVSTMVNLEGVAHSETIQSGKESFHSDLHPTTPSQIDNQRLESIEKALAILSQNHTQLKGKQLSELVEDYLNDLKTGWSEKNIANNIKDIKPKLTLFVDCIGNIKSDQLNKDHVVQYRNLLMKYPRNKNKMPAYRDTTLAEIATMDIPKDHQMSATSKNNYANRISGFLNWLSKSNYARPNLREAVGSFPIPPKAAHEERPEFTEDELMRLFNSKQYTEKGHKQASHETINNSV